MAIHELLPENVLGKPPAMHDGNFHEQAELTFLIRQIKKLFVSVHVITEEIRDSFQWIMPDVNRKNEINVLFLPFADQKEYAIGSS